MFLSPIRGIQKPELEILAVGPSVQGGVGSPLYLSMRLLHDPLLSGLSALTQAPVLVLQRVFLWISSDLSLCLAVLGKSYFCQVSWAIKRGTFIIYTLYTSHIIYIYICRSIQITFYCVLSIHSNSYSCNIPTADGWSFPSSIRDKKNLQWGSTNKRFWKSLSILCNMFIFLLEQNFKYR